MNDNFDRRLRRAEAEGRLLGCAEFLANHEGNTSPWMFQNMREACAEVRRLLDEDIVAMRTTLTLATQ